MSYASKPLVARGSLNAPSYDPASKARTNTKSKPLVARGSVNATSYDPGRPYSRGSSYTSPTAAGNSSASSSSSRSSSVAAVAPSPASNSSTSSSSSSSSSVTSVLPSPASNSSASSSPNVTAVAPSPASNSSRISSGAIAIFTSFAVVGGVALIVLAVLIIKYVRKKKLKTDVEPAPLNSIASGDPKNFKDEEELTPKDSTASTETFLDKNSKEKPTSFTPQDLQVFTRNNLEKLGCGGFGVVYKGEFPDGIPFAVKILNKDLGKRAEAQFIAEVSTLSRTNHANLVRLHGYCSDAEVKALVYEYMDNGSLDGYLYGQKAKIEWGKLYEIAVGTAEGIRYLHEECEKKIIHYDIKPANILLSKDFSPKVADFGLAEIFDMENTISTITGGKGTPGFVAPEVWETAVLTRKSDVYSFGKLLFEMLWTTWSSEFMQAEGKVRLPEWVREKVQLNELESVISNCGDAEDRMKTETMCEVALLCVQRDPKKRPLMSDVVEMLLLWNKKMDAPLYPLNSVVPIDADSEIVK